MSDCLNRFRLLFDWHKCFFLGVGVLEITVIPRHIEPDVRLQPYLFLRRVPGRPRQAVHIIPHFGKGVVDGEQLIQRLRLTDGRFLLEADGLVDSHLVKRRGRWELGPYPAWIHHIAIALECDLLPVARQEVGNHLLELRGALI